MARSPAAAIAEVEAKEGERFDRAVGYLLPLPRRAPTPPRLRLAFRTVGKREMEELVAWLVRSFRCRPVDAEDAAQGAFERQLRNEPGFFEGDPQEWWPRLCGIAKFMLLENRESQRRIVLTDAQVEPVGSATLNQESSALPASPAACDYTWVSPPAGNEDWNELQIIGAIQRFARHYERPPREVDCKALHRLPSPAVIRARFGSFGAALWRAGIRTGRRRMRTQREAARECQTFRRRNGRWPDAGDLRWNSGDLPGRKTMVRLIGSTNPGLVQQEVESILEEGASALQ